VFCLHTFEVVIKNNNSVINGLDAYAVTASFVSVILRKKSLN